MKPIQCAVNVTSITRTGQHFKSLLSQQILNMKTKLASSSGVIEVFIALKPLQRIRVQIGNITFVTPCGDTCSNKNKLVI